MTAGRRARGIAAVVATLMAVALATTAQSDAHAAAADGPARAETPAHTEVHLHLSGCDRCEVQLYQAISGRPSVWHSASRKVGADHRVSFRVPTRRTHGMSFTLDAPWATGLNAIPNAVTRYRGHGIDSMVTHKAARAGTYAEGCWAGTRVDSVRLDFAVDRVKAKTVTGDPTLAPLVYATHTMSSWKPMVKTFKGMIANQEAFYCTRPKHTLLTFQAPGCNDCHLQLLNGARRLENLWVSPTKKVANGAVQFRIPTPLTRGVSATVHAPWEGAPPFTTTVVWRYGGHEVGDAVTVKDARSRSRASGCWGGTATTDVTVALTVSQVTVQSTAGSPTTAAMAFAAVTQPWLPPMSKVKKGVLGTQDVLLCQK